MPINSRRKGKDGELEAVHYMHSLGFTDARRSQQYNGLGNADIVCPESLPNVHVECKRRKDMELGSRYLRQAYMQACSDSVEPPKEPCVLWRRDGRRIWNLSFAAARPAVFATVTGDEEIAGTLRWLNGEGDT